MHRLLVLLLVAGTACGSKSALQIDEAPAPARPDLSLVDASPIDAAPAMDATSVPTCALDCGFCVPRGPILELADFGQRPDVAYGAGVVLVAFDDRGGNSLVAVSLEGERLWSEPLGGTQRPRIAYDGDAGAGLVAFDSGVRWLGANGRPMGETQRIDLGFQIAPDVAVVDGGFSLMIGAFTYASPPPLYAARVGRTPGPVDPIEIEGPGPWDGGEHAFDERGRATYAGVTTWDGPGGTLYDLRSDPPEPVDALEITGGPVLGMARGLRDEVFLLRDGREGLKLQMQAVGEGRGVDTWLAMDPRGQDGALVALGDRSIALVTSSISESDGATLGCVNVRDPTRVSRAEELAERPTLSVRAAPIPQGLAVVWTELTDAGEPAPRLRLLDCCIRE